MSGASDLGEGEVSVCGVAGEALASPQWRGRVAYIPQHPYVLAGTLRDNVALYAPDAGDEAVWDALESVALADLARSLPRGLDCALGAGGRALSGGEAHRLALARAIVGGRDVWLLDEPGSSLDARTQAEIREAVLDGGPHGGRGDARRALGGRHGRGRRGRRGMGDTSWLGTACARFCALCAATGG